MSEELENKLRELKESFFVSHLALVEKVYPEDMRADVRLKTKKQVNDKEIDPPKINQVPISHHKSKTFMDRKLPEEGDVCWLVFLDRSIDQAIQDVQETAPDLDRVHDESDAILVGEWTANSENIPGELGSMSADDWLIGLQLNTNSRIYMRKNGNIVIHPGMMGQIELVEDAKYSVPLFEKILQLFLMHTHSDPLSGSTGPPITGTWGLGEGSNSVKVDN